MKEQALTEAQKNRMREILSENNLEMLGCGIINGKLMIGARPLEFDERLKSVTEKVKDEMKIDTIINI